MAFVRLSRNTADTPEEAAVPEGLYELEIIGVQEPYEKEETGRTVVPVTIKVCDPDYPDAALVRHWLTFPNETDWDENKSTASMLTRSARRFFAVFGIEDGADFEVEDWVGLSGKCYLGVEEYEGTPQNRLKPPKVS